MEIVDSSDKLKNSEGFGSKKSELNLNLGELPVGKSLIINFSELDVKDSTLRSKVSSEGKKLDMKFKVIKHNNHKVYEIGRVS